VPSGRRMLVATRRSPAKIVATAPFVRPIWSTTSSRPSSGVSPRSSLPSAPTDQSPPNPSRVAFIRSRPRSRMRSARAPSSCETRRIVQSCEQATASRMASAVGMMTRVPKPTRSARHPRREAKCNGTTSGLLRQLRDSECRNDPTNRLEVIQNLGGLSAPWDAISGTYRESERVDRRCASQLGFSGLLPPSAHPPLPDPRHRCDAAAIPGGTAW